MLASRDDVSALLGRVMDRAPEESGARQQFAGSDQEGNAKRANERQWRLPGIYGQTLVTTNFGKVPAQLIRVGDRVMVRTGRYLRVQGIHEIKLDVDFVARHPDAKPVVIRQGVLGRNLPTQDVFFSPAQMIIADRSAARPNAACAAETSQKRQVFDETLEVIAYYEFQFDELAEICCEGIWALSPAD